MEEQRLAACAEKLKRLNEKHRQAAEGKPSPAQATNDEAGAGATPDESLSTSAPAPAPAPSPVPSVPVSQSQAPAMQAPLPERAERDRERTERERVEPSVEEEVHIPRQPSPPVQRPAAVAPEPQAEAESPLVEVGPLIEESQTDRTTVPIRDYFNIEDNRGKQARPSQSLFKPSHIVSVTDVETTGCVSLQWMSPTCLCLTWTPRAERKSPWRPHSWRERRQLLCVPLSLRATPNNFRSLCHLVSSGSR